MDLSVDAGGQGGAAAEQIDGGALGGDATDLGGDGRVEPRGCCQQQGARLATASGVPARASAKAASEASTAAPADPPVGKAAWLTATDVASRLAPARRVTLPVGAGEMAPATHVAAATFTTCQVPPKDTIPSPLTSLGPVSPLYRYSGMPLSVTWLPLAFVVVPSPVTPGPAVGCVPAATTRGGQNVAHVPVHRTGAPLLISVYSVSPLPSARTAPNWAVFFVCTVNCADGIVGVDVVDVGGG